MAVNARDYLVECMTCVSCSLRNIRGTCDTVKCCQPEDEYDSEYNDLREPAIEAYLERRTLCVTTGLM